PSTSCWTRPTTRASRPQAAAVGCGAGLSGSGPGAAGLPRRAPLAAVLLWPAGPSVPLSAQPAGLQQAAAPGPLAAGPGPGLPGRPDSRRPHTVRLLDAT